MQKNQSTPILILMLLMAVGLGTWSTSAHAQPYWLEGTVRTTDGDPISGANVWFAYIGAANQDVTEDTTNSAGEYDNLPYMPHQYDIRLGANKAGYEFEPPSYVIAKNSQNAEYITRNFTGIKLAAWTSGQARELVLLSGKMTYGYINIPPDAVEWKLFISGGTGNRILVPVFNEWPGLTTLGITNARSKKPVFKIQEADQTITINASSDPPLQPGKWYIGVYAEEDTTFTLSTRLTSADPDPTISGKVLDAAGDPVAGATVTGTNDADTAMTDDQGAYTLTVPFYWTGEVLANYNGGRFEPFDVGFSDINLDQDTIDFQGLKYPLTINSDKSVASGAGWYDDGETATWNVAENMLPDGAGTRWMTTDPTEGQEVMNAARTVDVTWSHQHLLTTSVTPNDSGTVTPFTSWVNENTGIEISAGEQNDWTFSGFSGSLSGAEASQVITMTGPKSVTAHFTTENPPAGLGDINVPNDYGTIQAAIDAAAIGDEIYVQPGTYNENIQFKGKDVVVRSYEPTNAEIVSTTIIDATSGTRQPAVLFDGTETSACLLQGFTITKAYAHNGAIEGNGTLAGIKNNIIKNNKLAYDWRVKGSGTGGAIYDCDGEIAYNTITDNSAVKYGGGLAYCDGNINHNSITNCSAIEYAGAGFWQCNATLDSNFIGNNEGYGIYKSLNTVISNCIFINNSDVGMDHCENTQVINCIFVNNEFAARYCDSCTMTNTIIWANDAGYKPGTFVNSCIQNWASTENGCFSEDPAFVNLAVLDLRLTADSPCIDTGATTAVAYDYRGVPRPFDGDGLGAGSTGDGSDFDIGAYEYATSTPLAAPVLTAEPPVTAGIKNTLEWSEVPGTVNYRIECAVDDSFTTPDLVVNVNAPSLTGTLANLSDETYFYRVCAVDQVGTWGEWSNVATSTQDATMPAFLMVSANPPLADPGMIVDITFVASEPLTANPAVSVNGHESMFFKVENGYLHYRYTLSKYDPRGAAVIKIVGEDMAGLSGVSIVSDALTRSDNNSAQDWQIYN